MTSALLPKAPWLPYAMLATGILGFADATYLTVKHYTHSVIPCSLTQGCEIVTSSAYSEIAGIPVALLGSIYYATVALLTFAAIESNNRSLLRYAGLLTGAGLLASAWFVFSQLVLIKAICQWCMVSAGTSTILFVLGFVLMPRYLKGSTASSTHLSAKDDCCTDNANSCCTAENACCKE